MSCHNVQVDEKVFKKPNKILLMGNPNVGKSIFFTELTGIHAMSSNYAGTTVNFLEGKFRLANKDYTLIDVPGTYSLSPTSQAEAVAARFVESGASAVICVMDATNLERNLQLALELKQCGLPIVYVLNLMDVAARHGTTVNTKLLSQELGAPVVEAVAVKKQGFDKLLKELENILQGKTVCDGRCNKCESCPNAKQARWNTAKEITRRVVQKNKSKPSFMDKLGNGMTKPFPGIFIALFIMAAAVSVVVFGGRGFRAGALLPLVNDIIVPFFRWIFTSIFLSEGLTVYHGEGYTVLQSLGDFFANSDFAMREYIVEAMQNVGGLQGVLFNVFAGEFGIFVISFEWILALIFPYVLLFYIVFTFLEDTGFLPRMSVLFDNIMRKLGVQGGSLIHMAMGYGCAVPAIIGTRAATSRKERLIITAAICFAVPCISQTAALMALLSAYSWYMLPAMILFSLVLFASVTLIAGKFIKGKVDPLLIEVPNLLMPNAKSYFRKLLTRMRHFLKDAEVPMMIAIVVAALLAETGLLNLLAYGARPLVSGWLGLPEDAVTALILGIVRREMSVAPLLALELTPLQAFVGGAVSLMYIPCLSVFAILAKEFKIKVAIVITVSTIVLALFLGGLINHTAQLFM